MSDMLQILFNGHAVGLIGELIRIRYKDDDIRGVWLNLRSVISLPYTVNEKDGSCI